ncbi:HAMP domain-containing sensor histidine kinase [Streptomyces sp. NPDC050617]|uniref:HAMP domain-containing sensor histidine kinase n=1 Tax=Streptomyces sp. NPDC050617 TaxID=3154628 RepID=UPI003437698A
MGLRTKTGVAITATAALVAVIMGLVVHHRTAANALDTARDTIRSRLSIAVDDHAAGVDRRRVLINPAVLPAPVRAAVARGETGVYLDRGGPEPELWAARRSGKDVIALRHSYLRQDRKLEALDRDLLLAGSIGTALACLIGVAFAAVLGRRLDASARTAERIAEGDLSARIAPRGNDEIARLTTALNTMADALAARLQAERDVTSDIAHELRTPVAGLVAAAGLLPPGRPAELVRERARRVSGLVEDVLEVARLDGPTEQAEPEVRPLDELVRRAVRSVTAPGQEGLEVRVIRAGLVETDARRVERILANLVSNAFRHGAAPVRVEVEGAVVRVYDQGPGFPPELLARGPVRFRTGAGRGADGSGRGQGLGLGLTIAAGQARVLGARLRFANPAGGGAEAVLDLRASVPEEEAEPVGPVRDGRV